MSSSANRSAPSPRLRAIIAFALGLPLALLAGLQALSGVLTHAAPDIALTVFPFNAMAREQAAFARFRDNAGTGEAADLAAAAQAARGEAIAAIAAEPLVPKAHVLVTIATADGDRRTRILDLASRFNRRDLALQGLVLERGLEARDFSLTVETLDQILRVHPEYRERFFPVLLDALAQPDAVPVFATILDGSATWQERFLSYAVRRRAARPALAQLRSTIDFMDERFDSVLIAGLAGEGETALARDLYRRFARGQGDGERSGSALSWASGFPPFEWALTDERYVRAQPSLDGERLEVFVQSGNGGLLARRIVDAREGPFTLVTSYDGAQPVRSDAVRLTLGCLAGQDTLAETTLAPGTNRLAVEALPPDCSQMVIELTGRALRGEPALRFELEPLRFAGSR